VTAPTAATEVVLTVIDVAPIDAIVHPDEKTPPPVTACPTAKPAVLDTLITARFAVAATIVPVIVAVVSVVGPVAAVPVVLTVIEVPLTTVLIVAPEAKTPLPDTDCPAIKPV
jgi:hypothetical protein